MKIELYTDGAASRNGYADSVAGWAWCLVIDGEEVHNNAGRIPGGTNNQGELQAIIEGLDFIANNARNISTPITVISDSSYCIKGITEWIHNWKKNNWYRNKQQTDEVKNKDYWVVLDTVARQLNLNWQWCKGHANTKWNNVVDRLAQAQTKGVK